MKARAIVVVVVGLLFPHGLSAQETRLQLVQNGSSLQLSYDTVEGKTYTVETSTNLSSWDEAGLSKMGDGLPASHEVGPISSGYRYFRVVVSDTPTGLAPEPAQMTDILVGTIQLEYSFTSATEFAWHGETGRWTYEKTGADTGKLVLTYDEDGNDPSVYREEISLTFTSATAGSFVYYEYLYNQQIDSSSGPFSLD